MALLSPKFISSYNRGVQFGAYFLLCLGLFWEAYTWLIQSDWVKEDYNYAFLVPLIGFYLFWERRHILARYASVPTWKGLLPVVLGLTLFWLGELGGEYYTLYFSSWLIAAGLLLTHLGWRKFRQVFFAVLFMLAMFPPPNFLATKITLKLQLISSHIGVALIQLYGLSAYREGNVIDLGFTQLQVVEACSGLRFLIPLLVLGALLAYMYKEALWKRLLLIVTTIPLSIITNSLRIALTGILYETFGQKVADGFFHGFSGWFIFMFSLGVLISEMWLLGSSTPKSQIESLANPQTDNTGQTDRLGEKPETSAHEDPEKIKNDISIEKEASDGAVTRRRKIGLKTLLNPPQFVAAVVLLAMTLALSTGISFREKIPPQKSFDQFPLSIGKWQGTRQLLAQKFITELDFSDYILADYRNQKGQKVNFYVAYYESQRKGESIHSPASCLPGGGWEFKQSGTVQIVLSADRSVRVRRARLQQGEAKQMVYYWFPKNGRVLTNLWQLKIYTFWDALTRQRTEGALVRLVTPVYPTDKRDGAEKRLKRFAREVGPVLARFLPDKTDVNASAR